MKGKVATDKRLFMGRHDLQQTYVAGLDVLKERVRSGQMTAAEAKLTALQASSQIEQELTNQVNAGVARAGAAGSEMLRRSTEVQTVAPLSRPVTTNCQRVGYQVNCTTF